MSSTQAASLALLIYDNCITFDDEVNFIWSMPNQSWVKWHFLFTRYFALAAQITNLTINNLIVSHISILSTALRNWSICQVIFGSIPLIAVEFVLMARVYALYNKKKWVASGFVVLILTKVIALVIGIAIINILPTNQSDRLFRTSPRSYLPFGICAIISQVTILALTLIKYWTATREGWSAAPIVALVVRDGIVTFLFLIIVITLTLVATSIHCDYALIGNSWLTSIAACAGCRLIINMQQFSRQPGGVRTLELTTIRFESESEE